VPVPPEKMKAHFGKQDKNGKKKPPEMGEHEEDGGGHHAADGDDDEGGEPSINDLVQLAVQKVKDGKGEPDLMSLSDGYDPDADGDPPSWVDDESTWSKAKEAVDPEGKGKKLEDVWAIVAHVYKALGGGVSADADGGGDDE
jgi:hypothetical protein